MSVIDLFEKDLLNKLSFKASAKISNDALLLKTFKFFDLNNAGWVPRSEFFRAIAKAGVVISSPEDMNAIFEYYDRSKEGRIHYHDFVAQVLSREEQQEEPLRKSTKELIEEKLSQSKLYRPADVPLSQSQVIQHKQPTNKVLITPEDTAEYLKERLREEGIDGLLDKAVKLKVCAQITQLLDNGRTHKLSLPKVSQVLSQVTREQLAKLLRKLNVPEGGEVNYAELVYFLRGKTSPQRSDLILAVFDRLDMKRQGEISLEELFARNEDVERRQVFEKAVEDYCRFQGIDDGVFTDEDFSDFMGFVGFVFNDQDFRLYLNCAYPDEEKRSVRSNRSRREFQANRSNYQPQPEQPPADFSKKPTGETGKKASQASSEKAESIIHKSELNRGEVQSRGSRMSKTTTFSKSIENILNRVSRRLAAKGAKGYLSFEKALRSADLDQDSLVNLQEFKKVVRDQRIDISETEAHMVFEVFDPEATGLMNYQELVNSVKGTIDETRRRLINRVWDKVKESETITTFNRVRNAFNVRAHPDIRNGKRYEEEILKELNETLLLVQDLNGVRSEELTRDDFEEYLQNVSYSVEDDRLFETTLVAVWRLTSENRIEDHYAGSRKHFEHNKSSYLQDHHRYLVNGGSVSQNAPFGTYNEPTNYATQSRRFDN